MEQQEKTKQREAAGFRRECETEVSYCTGTMNYFVRRVGHQSGISRASVGHHTSGAQ
jgi:hypothetical protein